MLNTIILLATLLSPPWQPVDGAGNGPGEDILSATCPQARACYLLDAAGNIFFLNPDSWQWQWRSRQQQLQPERIYFTGFLVGYLRSRRGGFWHSSDGGRSFEPLAGTPPVLVARVLDGPPGQDAEIPQAAQGLCPGDAWLTSAPVPGWQQEAYMLLAGRAGSLALLPEQPGSRGPIRKTCRQNDPLAAVRVRGEYFWLCRRTGVSRLSRQGQVSGLEVTGCRQTAPVGDNNSYILDKRGCLWFLDLGSRHMEKRACWPGARGGSLHFTNPERGMIIGVDGFQAVTVDGGYHWTLRRKQPSVISGKKVHPELRLPAGEEIGDLASRDEFRLLVIGRSGRIWITENGGHSWSPLELPNHARACRIACLDTGNTCLVADCNGNLFLLQAFSHR